MGNAALVAEYLGDTGQIRLKTFDQTDLVLTDCEFGGEALWATLVKVAISQGLTSLGVVE